VLGTNISRGPALPVTGPHFPLGALGVLGLWLVGAGMVIVRRTRVRPPAEVSRDSEGNRGERS